MQVFHLPEVALDQAQPLGGASADSDDKEGYQVAPDVDGFAEASAVDTGRWGKQLHEPSHFLSHELWGKLGKA